MNREIPIFFSIDDGYVPFLSVAISSAIKNSNINNKYVAIVLHQNVSEENRHRIESLGTENFKIRFISIQLAFESISDKLTNKLRAEYYSLTIYFRIFIASMFPQYDKAIYIDSDVVVLSDLADLYNVQLGDNYIGACHDHSVVDIEPLAEYMEYVVGVNRHKYINSGVLLMDLKKLRESKFDKHFLSLLNTYNFSCVAPDQDYINAMCKDKIYYLDPAWDAMPTQGRKPIETPNLIHYNLIFKPWCYDDVQYEEYFWTYAKECGFWDEIIKYRKDYSDEQKEIDAKCVDALIERADEIGRQDVTFRKVYESGAKVRL